MGTVVDWLSFGIGAGIAIVFYMIVDWIMENQKQKQLKQRRHDKAVQELYQNIRDDLDETNSRHGDKLSSIEDRIKKLEAKRK